MQSVQSSQQDQVVANMPYSTTPNTIKGAPARARFATDVSEVSFIPFKDRMINHADQDFIIRLYGKKNEEDIVLLDTNNPEGLQQLINLLESEDNLDILSKTRCFVYSGLTVEDREKVLELLKLQSTHVLFKTCNLQIKNPRLQDAVFQK